MPGTRRRASAVATPDPHKVVAVARLDGTAQVRPSHSGFGMILQRQRVHALIDARLPGAIWLHGPTGAGKTVALRTYLERSGLPSLWLALDERHRDPAALFASIGIAVSSIGARSSSRAGVAPLPSFSPEHRNDPGSFARDYFARLDTVLPPGHALVVDDVHHADDSAALLGHAIDAFAGRRPLFFASQLLPGRDLAAHLAGSRLWTIGHRQLAFDVDEARLLAHVLSVPGEVARPMVDALLAATDGWAAGLMLAMQLGPPSSGDSGDPLESLRSPLAHLIATQVLRGVAPHDFRRLRVLAELPQVPMSLVDIDADWASACSHLDRLADRGLFVERLPVDRTRQSLDGRPRTSTVARLAKGCWRLHDLFRSALREAGPVRDTDDALSRALIAHLLVLERLDLAWQLATFAGSTSLDALVAGSGTDALRDADLPLLRDLAAQREAEAPRVALWRARALLGTDTAAALAACDAAYRGFERDGMQREQAQATSLALFIVFAAIEHVGAIAVWVARFEEADQRAALDDAHDVDPALRAIDCAAEVMHDLQFGGRRDEADAFAMQDRLVTHVIDGSLPPDEAILAGSLAVASMERSNRIAQVETAIVRIEALPAYARAAPHIRANWGIENGYHFVRLGSHGAARRSFGESLRLSDENALVQTRVSTLIGLVRLELAAGDVAAARERFAQLKALGAEHTGAQSGLIQHLQARIELASDEPRLALQSIETATRLMNEQGFPRSQTRILDSVRMQALFALQRHDESEALGRLLMSEGPAEDRERMKVNASLMRAVATWPDERDAAEEDLVEAMTQAARINQVNFIPLLATVAASACARALALEADADRRITPSVADFVRRAIRTRALPAPIDAPSSWPWPIRIELLGPFTLYRDGVPMRWSGKVQQKPLELLKLLACERRMTGDLHGVASALWPDADEGGARKSLEVTVSRLRKLLEDDSLVLVREGRVSLDTTRVSSDAREFMDVAVACESSGAKGAPANVADDLAMRLLALFKALPLEQDEGVAWREGMRERYRGALVRAVRSLASRLEDSGDVARSTELLEAAVAREPLAEALYQHLIRIYARTGQAAEAMRTYRQCRQMLSILIGAAPSAETERLKEAIHSQGTR